MLGSKKSIASVATHGRAALPEVLEGRQLFSALAYTVIDLGTLGGTSSEAFDINNSNQVVGQARAADGSLRAFRFFDADGDGTVDPGEMVNLGVFGTDASSAAYGINDAGVVVGQSKAGDFGRELAVRFDVATGTVADLGLGAYSTAYGVNAGGAIAGYADNPAQLGQNRGFVRAANGTVSYFTLTGAATTEAFAINDSGVVAGRALGPNGNQAFVRLADGTVREIGFLPTTGRSNQAADINAGGVVVGEGVTVADTSGPAGQYRAFTQSSAAGSVASSIRTLPANYRSSYAQGVNDAGVVVGTVSTTNTPGDEGSTHGFVYANGTLTDLNQMIMEEADVTISEARAINNAGYIVGTGINANGQTRAILLVPVPGVLSVAVNGGGVQRSKVNNVTVGFNSAVQLDAGAFQIVPRAGGMPLTGVTFTGLGDDMTFTVNFDPATLTGGSLADGVYDLRVIGSKVHSFAAGGETLDGVISFAFHRLYGDNDGDGDVDAADLFQLRKSVNKSVGQAGFNAAFDYDNSNVIDAADLFQIRKRARVEFKGY